MAKAKSRAMARTKSKRARKRAEVAATVAPEERRDQAPKREPDDEACTLVYVHGIGPQVGPATLKRQYDRALLDGDAGDRTRLAYWADILHQTSPQARAAEAFRSDAIATDLGPDLRAPIEKLVIDDKKARAFARKLYKRMTKTPVTGDVATIAGLWAKATDRPFEAKILPIPSLRRWVTEVLTRLFIVDVAAYLYDDTARERIRDRLRSMLVPHDGRYVLVTHSWGTVIAYDILHELGATPTVPLWVTLGSPLGMDEVQDHLTKPLEVPPAVQRWVNFSDPLDPVAIDHELADDFSPSGTISDHLIVNEFSRSLRDFNPHAALGYLGDKAVRRTVQEELKVQEGLGVEFAQPTKRSVVRFVVARDLAAEMVGSPERLPVLIQLNEALPGEALDDKRKELVGEIEKITRGAEDHPRRTEEAKVDELRRYVAAELTAAEIAHLSALHKNLCIEHIWKDSQKQALLDVSTHRLQAYTAQLGYQATGKGIAWAVLDTGVNGGHPHFVQHGNIAGVWDCRVPGKPLKVPGTDPCGHGTHVAGIIAGTQAPPGAPPGGPYVGMAPQAKLHVYEVLDDDGSGRDSWIIKALEHIGTLNEKSAELVIHGVNLSLGGPFDAEVFGCGHSPLCQELRRLWRLGVVVCVAAGNEGRMLIDSPEGRRNVNLPLSIGDPANLDEAIAVGSVHKEYPDLYGVSYFSSRGPTADGRMKPDVVAPGEKIMSCNAAFLPAKPQTHYLPLSGTSMACPHVSGILAAFLSVRREFIGRPDELKRLLLATATDLNRDRHHQGAGMPNLIRMLAGT